MKVMDELLGQYIYCALIIRGDKGKGRLHMYQECSYAKDDNCGYIAYKQWREKISFGQAQQCWECGLSMKVCRRLEKPAGE